MKSDENQYISTRNQLQSSEAGPEDARCTPVDISPKRVSSNCQSPIVPLSCRCVASVRLERCDDCQVLQGVTVIKSEEPLAEGFLPPDKTCHQKDRRPKKPHIQVKSETTESDECSSNPSTSRAEEGIILSSVVCGEEDRGALTDFQTSVLLRLQSLEEAQMEMLQLLRSFVGVNKAAEELDDVLPASTHEELGMLCERLSCQVFKKQLTCYLTSLGGQNIGDSVRRMLRKIGTNALWCGYSLKGKKGKIAFIDLPVARVINRACLVNHPKARIYEVETEMAECLKHAPNKRGGPKYKPPPPKRIKHIKSSASSSPSDTDD